MSVTEARDERFAAAIRLFFRFFFRYLAYGTFVDTNADDSPTVTPMDARSAPVRTGAFAFIPRASTSPAC